MTCPLPGLVLPQPRPEASHQHPQEEHQEAQQPTHTGQLGDRRACRGWRLVLYVEFDEAIRRGRGMLMAKGTVIGNTSRLMTRACYAQIAFETGVPVDATKRELKIAWGRYIKVGNEALDELRFWVRWLPGHQGTQIHQKEVLAVVVLGQDVSDTAWGGFFGDGSGT